MVFDYSKLRGKIVEKYGTQTAFSEALGCTNVNFSRKMQGKTKFTYEDIQKITELLCLDKTEIGVYFFTQNV